MTRCMDVDEVKEVCKDHSRWRSVVSTYLESGVYVCMSNKERLSPEGPFTTLDDVYVPSI